MKNGFNGEILHILSRTQVYFLLVRSFSEEFSRFALICPTRLMGDCFPHASLPLRGLRGAGAALAMTAGYKIFAGVIDSQKQYDKKPEPTAKMNSPQRAQRVQRKTEGTLQKFKILRRNLQNLKTNFKNLSVLCKLRGRSDLFAGESNLVFGVIASR
jgi:hypothetical protein